MKIITVGKISKDYIQTGISNYSKRLQNQFKLDWQIIPHSSLKSPEQALKVESDHILSKLNPNDYVILLDEAGRIITSLELSTKLSTNQNIVFIIGGAYGIHQRVKARANFTWSLSKLVFPHQIVRLILSEQIYRAQTIINNHPYHHN